MPNCRSCGANIIWITLESGKAHPCDPDSIDAEDAEPGAMLVTEFGEVVRIKAGGKYEGVSGHTSHFASCPDADRWRKGA